MDGGAWWAVVHGVAKSWTWLSDFPFTFHFHALENEMATHSSVLAWRIPWMEKPGRLLSMGSHRVGHDWSDLAAAAAAVNSIQSCLTLCIPMGYSVRGILQARILEWVAFPFSQGFLNSEIKPRSPALLADSLPAEPQGKPKNTGGWPIPSPTDLPDTGIELGSPVLQADSLPVELPGKPLRVLVRYFIAYSSAKICLLFRYSFFVNLVFVVFFFFSHCCRHYTMHILTYSTLCILTRSN